MFKPVNKDVRIPLDELLNYIGEFLYNDYLAIGIYSEPLTNEINDIYYRLLFGVQPTALTSPVYWSKEMPHIHQDGNVYRLLESMSEGVKAWLRKLLSSLNIRLQNNMSSTEISDLKQDLATMVTKMNREEGPYGDTYEVGGMDYKPPIEVLNLHHWLFLLLLISLSANNFIRIFKEKLNACPNFTTYNVPGQ